MSNGYIYPEYPLFSSRAARVNSFINWPENKQPKPEQLADAGFFYTGVQDITMCYYCGGGLKEWEENDDPWQEHLRWFNLCPYVVMRFSNKKCSFDVTDKKV